MRCPCHSSVAVGRSQRGLSEGEAAGAAAPSGSHEKPLLFGLVWASGLPWDTGPRRGSV